MEKVAKSVMMFSDSGKHYFSFIDELTSEYCVIEINLPQVLLILKQSTDILYSTIVSIK